METSRFETKKLVRVVSISNRSNFCNQRLLNIYSHLYLRVLSPLRPYMKQYQAVRVVKQNIFFHIPVCREDTNRICTIGRDNKKCCRIPGLLCEKKSRYSKEARISFLAIDKNPNQ